MFFVASKRLPWRPLRFHENLVARSILCTIGCGLARATKDEKTVWLRRGVGRSYALFLLVIGAFWGEAQVLAIESCLARGNWFGVLTPCWT